MPQVKEVLLYQFDDLDESAKERARDWYREAIGWDTDWAEFTIDDFAMICGMIGIDLGKRPGSDNPKVWWSVGCCQGDGACFEGVYSHSKGALKAVKQYAPQDETLHAIVKRLVDVQRVNFYQLKAIISENGRRAYSGTMSVDVERDSPHYQEMTPGADDEVTDCLRSLADWLYYRLRDEWEYQNSDEAIDESIEANEYTFDEDGNLMD